MPLVDDAASPADGRRDVPRYAGPAAIAGGSDPLCILLGDTQRTTWFEFWRENNAARTPRLLAEVARRRPGFVLHLGDLTARGQSSGHWRRFDRVFRPVREASIPVIPVIGNHDYYGFDWLAFRKLHARFPFLEGRKWFSFQAGPVGFVLVDGNFKGQSRAETLAQADWFRETLSALDADTRVRAVILAVHQPPYSNNRVVGCSAEVREAFAAPFVASAKAVACFSGHSHAYEHFREGRVHFVVSGGGGGPRHAVALAGRKRRFADCFDGPAVRFMHFCELRMGPAGFRMDVVRQGDETGCQVVDAFTMGWP